MCENSIQAVSRQTSHCYFPVAFVTQPPVPFRMSLISMAFVTDGICGIHNCCRAAQPIAIKSRQPEPTSGVGAGSSHRDAVVRMEPRETAYEKKAPFRSWASSENSFTEVPAGSDANCAVAVFPDQAICATFCTKSPAKLFSTSRIFVRPMA